MRTICTMHNAHVHYVCTAYCCSVCTVHHAKISNFQCRIITNDNSTPHSSTGHKWKAGRVEEVNGVQIKIVFSSENNNIVHFIWTSICSMFGRVFRLFFIVNKTMRSDDVCIRRCCSKRTNMEWKKMIEIPYALAHKLLYEHTSPNEQWMLSKVRGSAWENKTRGMLYQLISSSSPFSVCASEIVCTFLPTSLSSPFS